MTPPSPVPTGARATVLQLTPGALSSALGDIDRRWAWRAFALGLGSNLFLPVGGRLSLLELAAVFALPTTIATAQRRPQVLYLVSAVGVLVLGGVISSFVHGVSTTKIIALVANYAVPVILVMGLLHLVDTHGFAVLRWLAAGSAVSQALTTFVIPDESQALDSWKFGYGFAASLLVLLLIDRARTAQGRLLGLAAGAGLTVAHLVLGARFLAVLVMIAVIASALSSQAPQGPRALERQSLVGKVTLGVLGVVVLYVAYGQLASSGALGTVAQYKYSIQTGDYGLLIGGRKELVFLFFAFLGSPLLGWGADSPVPYLERLDTARWFAQHHYHLDYADTLRLVRPTSLPLHSITFGMLVVAGAFAVPAVLALLTSGVRAVWGSLSRSSALLVYIALLGLVHLLTSPLGDTTRAPVAACVALGILFAARQPPPLHPEPGDTAADDVPVPIGTGR